MNAPMSGSMLPVKMGGARKNKSRSVSRKVRKVRKDRKERKSRKESRKERKSRKNRNRA